MGRDGGGGWEVWRRLWSRRRQRRLPQEGPREAVGRRAGRLRRAETWPGERTEGDGRPTQDDKGVAVIELATPGCGSCWEARGLGWFDQRHARGSSQRCRGAQRESVRVASGVVLQGRGRQDMRGGRNETRPGQCCCFSGATRGETTAGRRETRSLVAMCRNWRLVLVLVLVIWT